MRFPIDDVDPKSRRRLTCLDPLPLLQKNLLGQIEKVRASAAADSRGCRRLEAQCQGLEARGDRHTTPLRPTSVTPLRMSDTPRPMTIRVKIVWSLPSYTSRASTPAGRCRRSGAC